MDQISPTKSSAASSSSSSSSASSLFQVFLRLRPPPSPLVQPTAQALYPMSTPPERFLTVEKVMPSLSQPAEDNAPANLSTHITIRPPSDSRKRAVEKFAFTRVFEEQAEQLDVFKGTGVVLLVQGVLNEARDGLVATLGVTGSGKSHTMLGSKTQRGMTQLSLDLLFQSLQGKVLDPARTPSLVASLSAADPCEAHIHSATVFLESIYGENLRGAQSTRALGSHLEVHQSPAPSKRKLPAHITNSARFPDISNLVSPVEGNADFAVVVSMYEVYNDRIFDLLSAPNAPKDLRRRALLFKSTEASPDRKVVAGLRKIVCGSYDDAMMVLETGLVERRVAGTGSNSVSSRSHGFFCVEVKRRTRGGMINSWAGSQLTIVDLAGSERARNARTAGATLAEAGKINESLMYLGQCLQMQSDNHESGKNAVVPFRQCKLTELLFSNSFPSSNGTTQHHNHSVHHHQQTSNHMSSHRNPQRAIMIVTADPLGDFNATSQILRYSALAREVTVPRIPSVSATILAGVHNRVPSAGANAAATSAAGVLTTSTTPSASYASTSTPLAAAAGGVDAGVVEMAFSEIARLNEELEILKHCIEEEQTRRREAEANWQRAEDKAETIELDVREECWAEMEQKLADERRRWISAWSEEADRTDERVDRKVDLLLGNSTSGIVIHEDAQNQQTYISDLEAENATLRREMAQLRREIDCGQSPSRLTRHTPGSAVAGSRDSVLTDATLRLNRMSLHSSPTAKFRRSTIRDSQEEDDEVSESEVVINETLMDENTLEQSYATAKSPSASPSPVRPAPMTEKRRLRSLTARQRDLMDEESLFSFRV